VLGSFTKLLLKLRAVWPAFSALNVRVATRPLPEAPSPGAQAGAAEDHGARTDRVLQEARLRAVLLQEVASTAPW